MTSNEPMKSFLPDDKEGEQRVYLILRSRGLDSFGEPIDLTPVDFCLEEDLGQMLVFWGERLGGDYVIECKADSECTSDDIKLFFAYLDEEARTSPRLLRRLGLPLDWDAFPLPPPGEVTLLPNTASYYNLCAATDKETIADFYRRIVEQKVPTPDQMEAFGGYLFLTLIGERLWNKLKSVAGAERLELALSWREDDRAMNRLPWEMMFIPGDDFLAAVPRVAITRRVAGASHRLTELPSPPRVLFVVGTDLTRDVIRPGAEYLGLIRALDHEGLSLKTHLLLEATTEKLEEAVKWFRPTVVHFICHGWVNNGRSYIQLRDKDDPILASSFDLYGDQLLRLLRTSLDLPLPPIVVLNACYTASAEATEDLAPAGQVSTPLAVELVRGDARGGIPIVVAMGGEVSDQACRLFTWGFYHSLLEDGDLIYAAAEGRRFGILHGSDPRATARLAEIPSARESGRF